MSVTNSDLSEAKFIKNLNNGFIAPVIAEDHLYYVVKIDGAVKLWDKRSVEEYEPDKDIDVLIRLTVKDRNRSEIVQFILENDISGMGRYEVINE